MIPFRRNKDAKKGERLGPLSLDVCTTPLIMEKARGYSVGTIRTWKGRRYQKQTDGKWTEVADQHAAKVPGVPEWNGRGLPKEATVFQGIMDMLGLNGTPSGMATVARDFEYASVGEMIKECAHYRAADSSTQTGDEKEAHVLSELHRMAMVANAGTFGHETVASSADLENAIVDYGNYIEFMNAYNKLTPSQRRSRYEVKFTTMRRGKVWAYFKLKRSGIQGFALPIDPAKAEDIAINAGSKFDVQSAGTVLGSPAYKVWKLNDFYTTGLDRSVAGEFYSATGVDLSPPESVNMCMYGAVFEPEILDNIKGFFNLVEKGFSLKEFTGRPGNELHMTVIEADSDRFAGMYNGTERRLFIDKRFSGAIPHEIGHHIYECLNEGGNGRQFFTDFMQWINKSGLADKINQTFDKADSDVFLKSYPQLIDGIFGYEMKKTFTALQGVSEFTPDDRGVISNALFNASSILNGILKAGASETDEQITEMTVNDNRRLRELIRPFSTQWENPGYVASAKGTLDFLHEKGLLLGKSPQEVLDSFISARSVIYKYPKSDSAVSTLSGAEIFLSRARHALNAGRYQYESAAYFDSKADYFTEPTEIFARTFQRWVAKKNGFEESRSSFQEGLLGRDNRSQAPGWSFPEVDPDYAMLDGFETLLKNHAGQELVKAMRLILFLENMQKGKGFPVGTIRIWKGKRFRKTTKGWIEIRGEGQSHAAVLPGGQDEGQNAERGTGGQRDSSTERGDVSVDSRVSADNPRGADRYRNEGISLARAEETIFPQSDSLAPNISGILRAHQRDFVNLALEKFEAGEPGILNMDGTGAGKTLQELALASEYLRRHPDKPVFIFTENKRIIENAFKGDAEMLGVPITAVANTADVTGPGIYVTTYNRFDKFAEFEDGLVILDESHNLKNKGSQKSKRGISHIMNAKHTALFSATPLDKGEQVLYLSTTFGLRNAAVMAYLGYQLKKIHIKGGATRTVYQNMGDVREVGYRIEAMFDELTRRGLAVKREVPLDNMTVDIKDVELSEKFAERYAKAEADFNARVAMAEGSKLGIVTATGLLGLRRLMEEGKATIAYDTIKKQIATGKQVVLFATRVNDSDIQGLDDPSAGTLRAIADKLGKEGIPFSSVFGGEKDVPGMIHDFQMGLTKVLITTPQSGGTGISLDDRQGGKPRHALVITPPFSAMEFVQMAGRINRLTTKSPAEMTMLTSKSMIDSWNKNIIAGKLVQLGSAVKGDYQHLDLEEMEAAKYLSPDDLQAYMDERDTQKTAFANTNYNFDMDSYSFKKRGSSISQKGPSADGGSSGELPKIKHPSHYSGVIPKDAKGGPNFNVVWPNAQYSMGRYKGDNAKTLAEIQKDDLPYLQWFVDSLRPGYGKYASKIKFQKSGIIPGSDKKRMLFWEKLHKGKPYPEGTIVKRTDGKSYIKQAGLWVPAKRGKAVKDAVEGDSDSVAVIQGSQELWDALHEVNTESVYMDDVSGAQVKAYNGLVKMGLIKWAHAGHGEEYVAEITPAGLSAYKSGHAAQQAKAREWDNGARLFEAEDE